MSKFQDFKFHSMEEFLEFLPANERVLVDFLRTCIMEIMPNCKEKLAYNVPFYYLRSRVVFLWPGAVPWGNLRAPGVQLGFCKGYMLPSKELLDQGDRKEVYSLHFERIEDIDLDMVKMLIQEAVAVDG